jgi:diacylglycerol kinase family enzyme
LYDRGMSAGAGPPGRIPVFLNASAGGDDKSGMAAQVQKLFADRGLVADVRMLEPGQDLVSRVRDGVRGACLAVAGGGDGTINLVASAIDGTAARLGVLPLGTLNHFAKDLGIPLGLEQAIGVIAAGAARPVDVGDVNGRVFLNNSSIGVYPSIVQARDALQQAGHRKWPAFAIAAARVLRRQSRISVRMQADGQPSTWRTPFVMVGNNEYDVTGLRIAGRSRLDAGRLFAYVAPHVRVLDLPKAIALEWFGRLLHRDAAAPAHFRMIDARELWIEMAGPRSVEVAIDGEVITASLPLHYRSRPGALQVFCPAA